MKLCRSKEYYISFIQPTSALQRRVVFGMDKSQVIDLATSATYMVKEHTDALVKQGTNLTLEYSPESFSATELDFFFDRDMLGRYECLVSLYRR